MYKSNRLLTIIVVSMVIFGLSAQNALALYMLPNTSYKNGKWQGSREFTSDGFKATVQYSVYDTQNGNEFAAKFGDNPGTGRYVYAYQVLNQNVGTDTKEIGFFALFGKNTSVVDSTVIDVNALNAGTSSKSPTYKYFDEDTKNIVWDFRDSLIVAGTNSWLLAYSSDYAPMVGDFTIKGKQEGDPPVPTLPTPEPATIAMLTAGAMMIIRKK